jgi:hypothetical protein
MRSSLYFTGTEAPNGSRPNFLAYQDPHIRLRKILCVGHQAIELRTFFLRA